MLNPGAGTVTSLLRMRSWTLWSNYRSTKGKFRTELQCFEVISAANYFPTVCHGHNFIHSPAFFQNPIITAAKCLSRLSVSQRVGGLLPWHT